MKRLEELRAEYDLPEDAPAKLERLLLELQSEPASVSSIRDPAQAVEVHIADSLSGLAVAQLRSAESIADLGAGGGFPGLALAAALPGAKVRLVESVGRKCAFIDRAAARAGIGNAAAVHARAEQWRAGLSANDVVTARALAPLGVLLEYAAPLLKVGGTLVAYKGHRDGDEEAIAARAAIELAMELVAVRRVNPFAGAGERHLHIYAKRGPTPERFPRRAGMARKRPLGTAR